MRAQLQFAIEPDHPSLAGHFPANPIIPGVVVLERALALLVSDRPGYRVSVLQDVKFLASVLPGETVTLDVVDAPHDRVTFTGQVGERTVLRGRIQLDVTS